ncbi:hypothetical protein CY35_14G099200 [Sphagnum magellanicum]|nr:hypothetical protein CY35_14G099200 [Sphagnum magellanicum]
MSILGSNTLNFCSSSLSFVHHHLNGYQKHPVQSKSLVDVAPLALVRDFLANIAQAVQDYKQRHAEHGAYHA